MGNVWSKNNILNEESVQTYAELTYLTKNQIQYIAKLLDNIEPGILREDLQHRFSTDQIETVFPEIRCSPFRDSIYRVFSSKNDRHLSLEDVLDLCSAFSENADDEARAAWAFSIFDFDGDNQISIDDLIEATQRLTGNDQDDPAVIDREEAEHVARMVLQEMVFTQIGSISFEEFIRFVSRIPELLSTFRFRI
ncbi:calcium and integrin-binding protein 1-like [Hylaeus volcanicus]|uniref:calcium and integrin-binding protein 1-like n=1 Tax=Hylaeus volcanicus TaxID=313075 RepID=UPI0023B7A131|nr:calcium and integrin-binding protein 1-like [Hylaeus volcanicus]